MICGISMVKLIEVETERLRLRQWRAADREPFAALNADAQVMEYFPATLSRAESDALAARCQAFIAERGWGLWAVETKKFEFIGFVGLNIPNYELPFSPCVEVGWRLSRRYWGRGYATEAAREALRVGFERLGFEEIVSFTALANVRSRSVMQRIGMRDTGEIFNHPKIARHNPLCRHCLYRLTRNDYLGLRSRPN